MKKVNELFGQVLKGGSLLGEFNVLEVKFSKKQNSANVQIQLDKKVPPTEIRMFEKHAEEVYSLSNFKIKPIINFNLNLDNNDIQDVIRYIEIKKPYLSNSFKGSNINLQEDKVTIELNVPNASFLKLRKAEETLSEITKTFYGKEYVFDIIDSKEISNLELENKEVKLMKPINKTTSKPLNQDIKGDEKSNKNKGKISHIIIGKDISKEKVGKIEEVNQDLDNVTIEGRIEKLDIKELKTGKEMFVIDIYDNTSTISTKFFIDPKKTDVSDIKARLKEGVYIKANGKPQYDMYSKELTIILRNISEAITPEVRMDNAKDKRVELHVHTQMSAMDGVTSATEIVKQAIKWGHASVAITDHGVLQSFPEANMAAYNYDKKAQDIKVIYGLEGYFIPDVEPNIEVPEVYTIFDIETTGFTAGPDNITEIAAVKVQDGKVIGEFSTFVNPERKIPKEVQELTHITEDMVKDAPTVDVAIKNFLDFAKSTVVVAHNARFDMSFIEHYSKKNGLVPPKHIIDTLAIAREVFESYENHKLGTIAQNLEISLEDAHRAINDARATTKIFLKMIEILNEKGIKVSDYVQTKFIEDLKDEHPYHIIILAKDYVGLKNLYKLVSFSHLRYFHKKPRISRSLLNRYRKGLIIGAACERGELFQAILKKDEKLTIESIAQYYDYLEIQPLGNNDFYIRNGTVNDKQDLEQLNKSIVSLGEKLDIPVVATCDVHFLNPEDEIYRRIIMSGQGYEDADNQAPLYFRTTEEMLEEFEYLGEDLAKEVVITNTNLVSNWIEEIKPVVSGTYNPVIEGSDEEIERLTYEKARSIYGEVLPEIVEARIKKELNSIISNGFSVMYTIAQKLVKRSNDDGYLVGSRGSVGSSFVATMTGITEVNPLPAHYICKQCKYSEFPETKVTTGIDMPDKICPECGNNLSKDGMDIPFETFLGFKGDKVPDIDLNFSGEYQAKAHAYTEELFGKSKTFRAGTISTLADKTAYGFVKKYYEGKKRYVLMPEINRISKKCTGIKRTTGQHPGGIIVVPKDKEIYDFCPVQRPADDMRTKTITTHFDFHSIHDNLLKLDILGHDDPTVIKMLEDITGIDAKSIPLDEPKVMSIFRSTEALDVTEEQIKSKVGTYAVPEFGTKFVRQMLVDTKPSTFGELVRISGLSHGTDVWLGNAQTLIQEGKATLREAICTRDDIMIYLIQRGLDASLSFKIMEIVRKGKAIKALTEDMQEEMRNWDVPEWYIDSCKKIKYMFPKAHAAAYVMMAYRIAYFKVYYPAAFYSTYYTVRADVFDAETMCGGKQKVKDTMKSYDSNSNLSQTEKDQYTILEVVNEMLERKINFLPIDLYKSDATKFIIEEGNIRPPFVAISTFGNVNAEKIIKARQDGKFSSKENLMSRSKIGKVAMELLDKYGCTKGMPNSAQVSLFEL